VGVPGLEVPPPLLEWPPHPHVTPRIPIANTVRKSFRHLRRGINPINSSALKISAARSGSEFAVILGAVVDTVRIVLSEPLEAICPWDGLIEQVGGSVTVPFPW